MQNSSHIRQNRKSYQGNWSYKSLPRDALLTIYKSFIKPHLDYCDVVYDQAESHLFIDKLEQVQYNAALAFI